MAEVDKTWLDTFKDREPVRFNDGIPVKIKFQTDHPLKFKSKFDKDLFGFDCEVQGVDMRLLTSNAILLKQLRRNHPLNTKTLVITKTGANKDTRFTVTLA